MSVKNYKQHKKVYMLISEEEHSNIQNNISLGEHTPMSQGSLLHKTVIHIHLSNYL